MTSLYVDRRGVDMRLDGGAIAFFEQGERIGTVPTEPLERVYLRGDIKISSGVLGRLGQMGIGVIILSGRRAEPALFMPRAHNDVSIRIAQTRLYLDASATLDMAKWLVRGKLRAQLALVEEWAETRPGDRSVLNPSRDALRLMVGHVAAKPCLDTLRGLEGAAAAMHFRALAAVLPPSAGFTGRNRRPPRDPVNAVLSLGYTLLMAEAALAAHGHGFDPAIGFLHASTFGRPSFACDLAEPLRPIIDRFTWRLFADQTLRARDFSTEKDGACLLMKAGRERFYGEVETPLSEARRRLAAMMRAVREMIETCDGNAALPDQL
ncbi:MAG: CRISPR-associated endonuclease Cas1 [Sphingomonadales bacterium]|nr:MAG: CRISPR-associated endonuclease Cas1 [Sphingomonadales bacterium]